MNNNTTPQKGFFKTLKIIYAALIVGVLIFTALTYLSIKETNTLITTNNLFVIVLPVLAASGYFLSNLLYKKILNNITSSDTLHKKMSRYLTANLLKAVCLEVPAFVSIAVTFVSGNIVFLCIALVMALLMYFKFPSKERFKSEVTLNMKEKTELDTM